MKEVQYYLALLVILFFVSCEKEKQFFDTGKFHAHSATDSGIDFKNELHDLKRHNALTYETFYSGGGVAIGDLNNDGLKDIYFSGNQVGDELYLNKGNWHFEKATLKSGIINDGTWSTGVTMVDINKDGWLDIYVCKSLYDEKPELRKNKLYINQKNGKFIDQAKKYGLDDIWRTQEACFFDYDNDDDLDVLIVNQPPNPGPLSPLKGQDFRVPELGVRFLENDNGKFKEITNEVGLSHSGYALSASITDFNNDGWLDMYIAHDYNSPDKLYLNTGTKAFTDKTNESCKQISFFSMGTDAADINNDGLEDFIVADMVASDPYRNKANMGGMNPESFWKVVNGGGNYQYMYNSLQLNNGKENGVPYFSNISQIAGVSKTDWSWSPLIADFDNDGNKDVFISNGIKRDLRFTDGVAIIKKEINRIKKEKNIGQDQILNNVNPSKLLEHLPSSKLSNFAFKNINGLKFKNIVNDWGLNEKSFSNGAAIGDLDNDGDLDLIVNNVDSEPFIYENKISNHNYIRVHLTNNPTEKVDINGVKVVVHAGGQTYSNTSKNNHGFYSCSESTLHFGLGSSSYVDSILVFWDHENYSNISNVEINNELVVYKSESVLKNRSTKSNLNLTPLKNYAKELNVDLNHIASGFDDYSNQVLLPYEISKTDLPFTIADFNGDKKDDIMVANSNNKRPQLFMQSNGKFSKASDVYLTNKHTNATAIISSDFDNDGDLDVYVSCGGNQFDNGHENLRNYFLINNGDGSFNYQVDVELKVSTNAINTIDFDNDGDLDLLVAAKYIPKNYPKPAKLYLLENKSSTGKIKFEDVSDNYDFDNIGLINQIIVEDLDGDNQKDLMLVGEWMPITLFTIKNAKFIRTTVPNSIGWWMSSVPIDFNDDGQMDFLMGNLGENAKYKSKGVNKFSTYFNDFDANGKNDIVLAYGKGNKEFPVRGRSCSSEQLPGLKSKFPTYHQFASNDLSGIYGDQLNESGKITVDRFSSILLKNNGGLDFEMIDLPKHLQTSAVQSFTKLAESSVLATGNLQYTEVETPKLDASYGSILNFSSKKDIKVSQKAISNSFSGQIESVQSLKIDNQNFLVYIPIGGELMIINIDDIQ